MIAGRTKISTPFYGLQRVDWFAENHPGERFLVYCWDKNDFTLGWIYNLEKVETVPTIRVKLDNGASFIVTPEHEVLTRNNKWVAAKDLRFADHLMAFSKLKPSIHFNKNLKYKQFPRIYTHRDGWKNERQFVDEWRTGKVEEADKHQYMINRVMAEGTLIREAIRITGHDQMTLQKRLKKAGYSLLELRFLGRQTDYRRIICVEPWETIDVYSVAVETFGTFCCESTILKSN